MPENLTDAEEVRLLDLSVLSTDKIALMTTLGTDATQGTEVTGGGYARASATFGPASTSAGVTTKTVSAPHLYINMPATTVVGWSIFSSDGATRKWYGLFMEKVCSAQAAGDTFTSTGHGLTNNMAVVFQSGFTPAGLTAGTTYYVVGSASNTFQVSATQGGAAVDITADLAVAVVGRVVTIQSGEVFAIPAGSLQLSLA